MLVGSSALVATRDCPNAVSAKPSGAIERRFKDTTPYVDDANPVGRSSWRAGGSGASFRIRWRCGMTEDTKPTSGRLRVRYSMAVSEPSRDDCPTLARMVWILLKTTD